MLSLLLLRIFYIFGVGYWQWNFEFISFFEVAKLTQYLIAQLLAVKYKRPNLTSI